MRVSATVESSYRVEVKSDGRTVAVEGGGATDRLTLMVKPGIATVRVYKANSRSNSFVLAIGQNPRTVLSGVPYGIETTVSIPESETEELLLLEVVPDTAASPRTSR